MVGDELLVLAPLLRSETMWHKVTNQRQPSSSRLSAFPKSEFGKWERRREGDGGDAEAGKGEEGGSQVRRCRWLWRRREAP